MTTYGQARADAARADLLAEVERLRAESVVRIDIHDIRPAEVLKRVILNLEPKRGRPLWALVHEATAHGSTVSAGLCRWAGRDPDTGAAIDSANQGESK